MNKDSIKEALDTLNLSQRLLKEDFGYGAPMGYEAEEQEMPQDISHYRGNEGVQQQVPQEEENTDMNLSKSDERIAQIREIALNGLQDYAQDVDSEAYQFYKKIWLMCDKAVSEKESASSGGSAS
jgi:hypothetical protein